MPTSSGSRWTGLSVSSGPITPGQFQEADGVGDWRVVADGACAQFPSGSFAAGVALVDAIGRLAEAADRHPDVDLRDQGVTVRLPMTDVGLHGRDVELARRISAAARELGVPADLAAWSPTSTPPRGGRWPTPRATRSTWPPGRAATERRRRPQRALPPAQSSAVIAYRA
jgi:pterin-4a-carbinolamine dehydratase